MRSDPRIGYIVSLVVAGLAAAWLLSLWFVADDLFAALGMSMHAITFLAIFVLISGLLVALLFRRFARVKSDLLSGRDVIERWRMSEADWRAFAGPADDMQRSDKFGVLLMIWGFIVVICGGFALAVPRDAKIFLYIGLGIALIVTVAFLLGTRVSSAQLVYRTGEVIVGRNGLIVNGVLYVWGAWLSWLESARFDEAPVPMLTVVFAYYSRYGSQSVTVRLPVPPQRLDLGQKVETELAAVAQGKGGERRHPRRRAVRRRPAKAE